jgi:hypothetical protein
MEDTLQETIILINKLPYILILPKFVKSAFKSASEISVFVGQDQFFITLFKPASLTIYN